MKITVKVLDAKQEVATYSVDTSENLLTIEGQDKVNYQLIDEATGFAPQNIIAKRVGNDLHILLEDGDLDSDIIIKDYYGDEEATNLLVGEAEDGKLYNYVPESGQQADAVSVLAEEVAAPQALGGESLASPLWFFNPYWLIPFAAAGLAIAAYHSHGDVVESNNNRLDAPTVTIPEATNGIDANELNDGIQINVDLPEGTTAGDKIAVTVTDPNGNTETITKPITQEDIDNGGTEFTIPKDKITGNGEHSITASVTDSNNNNKSEETTATVNVEAFPDHNKPLLTISEAQDGFINKAEIEDGVQATVTLPEIAQVGDVITVVVKDGQTGEEREKTHTITQQDKDTGTVDIVIPKELMPQDGSYSVNAKVTDASGQEKGEPSTSTNFVVDTTVPGNDGDDADVLGDTAPTISFPENTYAPFDKLNAKEIGDDHSTPVHVVLDGLAEGETVFVTINGEQKSKVVEPEDVVNGYVGFDVPTQDLNEIKVENAYVQDPAGNKSKPSEPVVITVDTVVPGDKDGDGKADEETKPTVEIQTGDDGDNKKVINKEDTENGLATAKITLPQDAGYKAGDELVVTKPDGTQERVALTEDNLNTPIEVTFKPVPGIENIVKAKVSDPAGNESLDGEDKAIVDFTLLDTPDLTISDAVDGFINKAEKEGGVPVEVKLPIIAEEGDKIVLKVKDADGNVVDTIEKEISATDKENGTVDMTIPETALPNDGKYEVTAEVVDPNNEPKGKTSEPKEFEVDTSVPGVDSDDEGFQGDSAPSIEFPQDKVEPFGTLNKAEVGEGKQVQVKITPPVGSEAGDKLIVKIEGEDEPRVVILGENPTEPVILPVDVTPETTKVSVISAKVVDPAGNESKDLKDVEDPDKPKTIGVDIKAPGDIQTPDDSGELSSAPMVSFPEDSKPKDEKLNGEEVGTDNSTPVKISFEHFQDLTTEDKIVLTINGEEVKIPLTQEMIDQGFYEHPVAIDTLPEVGGLKSIEAKAFIEDKNGNPSDVGSGKVTVDNRVPGDNNGDGKADPDAAPEVVINTGEPQDGVIHKGDLNSDNQATAKITFPADSGYSVGDKVSVTLPDGTTYEPEGGLTQEMLDNGLEVPFTPIDGEKNEVKVTVTDSFGNKSAEGTGKADADLRELTPPSVTVPEAEEGYINKQDLADDKIIAEVKLPDNVKAGDIIELLVKDKNNPDAEPIKISHTVNGDEAANPDHIAFVEIPTKEELTNGVINKLLPDGEYDVLAQITKPNGKEPSGFGEKFPFTVDTGVPGGEGDGGNNSETGLGKPEITFPQDKDDSGTLNKEEVGDEKQVSVAILPPVGSKAGDKLYVVIEGQQVDENGQPSEQPIILKDPKQPVVIPVAVTSDTEKVTVTSAYVEDAAKNKSGVELNKFINVDLKAPGDIDDNGNGEPNPNQPTAEFLGDENNDGKLNAKEVGEDGTATLKISFPEGLKNDIVADQDKIVLIVNGKELAPRTITAEEKEQGFVTYEVPAADREQITGQAYVMDKNNNKSVKSNLAEIAVDTTVPGDKDGNGEPDAAFAPTVTINTGTDPQDKIINKQDLDDQGNAQAKVTFPEGALDAGYKVGDKLIVTVNGVEQPAVELTEEMLTNGYPINFKPQEGENTVSVLVKDDAGNQVESEPATADADLRTLDQPSLSIPEAQDDGFVNKEELDDGKVEATVGLPEGVKAGDIVKLEITTPEGTKVIEQPVEQDGQTEMTVEIPASDLPVDGDYSVTAQVTKPNGQDESPKSEPAEFTRDAGVPGVDPTDPNSNTLAAPKVTFPQDEVAPLGTLNKAEVGDNKQVLVDIRPPVGSKAGDKLVVVIDGKQVDENGQPTDQPIILKDPNASVVIPVAVTSATEKVTVNSAYVEDAAKNKSGVAEETSVNVDIKAPGDTDNNDGSDPTQDDRVAPTVLFPDNANNDEFLSSDEVGVDKKIDIKVELPSGLGVDVGDKVILTVNGEEYEVKITEKNQPFVTLSDFSTDLIKANKEGVKKIEATARVEDVNGNPSKESEPATITVDTDAPAAPEVQIKDSGDGLINPSDLADNKAQAVISFPDNEGYRPGDKLLLTVNGEELEPITLTADDIANGYTHLFTPVDGQDNTVVAKVTDGVHTSEPGDDVKLADLRTLGKPELVVTDAQAGENGVKYVNKEDLLDSKVEAQVSLDDLREGDIVKLEISTPTGKKILLPDHIVTAAEAETNTAVIDIAQNPNLPADGDYTVVATVLKQGKSEVSERSDVERFTVDTGVPGGDADNNGVSERAPTIQFPQNTDNNDILVKKEVGDELQVKVEITPPVGSQKGDKLLVTVEVDGEPKQYEEVLGDNSTAPVTLFVPVTPDSTRIDVTSAKVVDPAGNESLSSEKEGKNLDLKAPGDTTEGNADGEPATSTKPTISFPEDNDPKGLLNKADVVDDQTPVKITFPKAMQDSFKEGDTLVLKINDEDPVEIVLDPTKLQDGIEHLVPTTGKDEIRVEAFVKDKNGNESGVAKEQVAVDTEAPVTPDLEIITNDEGGGIEPSDLVNGLASATVRFPADHNYKKGDQILLTVNGEELAPVTITDEMLQKNSYDFTFTPKYDSDADEVATWNEIVAKVRDQAGNTSGNDTEAAFVDLRNFSGEVPPILAIAEANDGYVNSEELKDNKVVADVRFTEIALEGDIIRLEITTKGGQKFVKDTYIDATAAATHTLKIDIPKVGEDGPEFAGLLKDGEYSVKAQVWNSTLGQKTDFSNTVDFTVDTRTFGDQTDSEGNSLLAPTVSFPEDVEAPTDVLNAKEVAAGTANSTQIKVAFDPALQGKLQAGDKAVITVETRTGGENGRVVATETREVVLEQKDIDANSVTIEQPTTGIDYINAKAYLSTAGGNRTVDSEAKSVTVDVEVPGGDQNGDGVSDSAPTIKALEDKFDPENKLNAKEAASDGNPNSTTLRVELPEGVKAGDTLETVINGTKAEKTLEEADINKGYVDYPVDIANVPSIEMTAQVKDPAGNASQVANKTIEIDTKVPGDSDNDGVADVAGRPVVVIATDKKLSDKIDDQVLDPADLTNGKAKATVTFPADANYQVGDEIVIMVDGQKLTTNPNPLLMTDEMLRDGYTFEFMPSGTTNNMVTVYVKDAAGNQSLEGSDSALMDIAEITKPPKITIPEAENKVNQQEYQDDIQVVITLPAGVKAGDTLFLNVGKQGSGTKTPSTVDLTEADIAANTLTQTIKGNFAEGEIYEVTAQIVRNNTRGGNPSPISAPAEFELDLTIPAAPTVTFPEDVNGNGKLNAPEINPLGTADGEKNKTPVRISLPEGTEEGDTVVMMINGRPQEVTVTADDLVEGKKYVEIEVPTEGLNQIVAKAYIKDNAGNRSPDSEEKTVEVDSRVPGGPDTDENGYGAEAPTVSFPEDKAPEGTLNAAEIAAGEKGSTPVRIGLPDEVKAGDIVVATINGQEVTHTLTADDIRNDYVDIPTAVTHETDAINVSDVYVKDPTGETRSKSGTGSVKVDNNVPGDNNNDGVADDAAKPEVTIIDTSGEIKPENVTISPDGTVTAKAKITFPANSNYKAGDTLVVTKPDGTTEEHVISEPELTSGVEVSFNVVKDQPTQVVTAYVKDEAGNRSMNGRDSATVDNADPATIDTISFRGKELGSVKVTPGTDNTKVVVSFTPEGAEDGVKDTVTMVKNPATQKWSIEGAKAQDPNFEVTPEGALLLKPNAVKDGQPVEVVTSNGLGADTNTGPATAGNDKTPDVAVVNTNFSGDKVGSATIKPGEDNTKLTITFEDEDDQTPTQKLVITKQADDTWAITEGTLPAKDVTFDKGTGLLTFEPNSLKDNVRVNLISENGLGAPNDTAYITPKSDKTAESPSINVNFSGENAGQAVISKGSDNEVVTVKFYSEDAPAAATAPNREIVIEKGENGQWSVKSNNVPATEFNPATDLDATNGTITLKPNTVKDGSRIEAIGDNKLGASTKAIGTAGEDKPADPVTIYTSFLDTAAGTVRVDAGKDNTKMVIKYFPEPTEEGAAVEQQELVLVKDAVTNQWKREDGSALPKDVYMDEPTGVVTLSPNVVGDLTRVEVISSNGIGADTTWGRNSEKDKATDKPAAYHVFLDEHQGRVTIQPGKDNVYLKADFTDEKDRDQSVTIEKKGKTWVVADGQTLPEFVNLDASNGLLAFTPNSVKDGTEITYIASNGLGAPATGSKQALNDKPTDAPTAYNTFANEHAGRVTIVPGADNKVLTATFTGEDDVERTVTIVKDDKGNWGIEPGTTFPEGVGYDPTPYVGLYFNPNSVKDGTEVTYTASNGLGAPATGSKEALSDKPSDVPTISVEGTGKDSGQAIVTPGQDNKKVVVSFQNEHNQPQTVTIVKGTNNRWSIEGAKANDPDLEIHPETGVLTLKPNAVKDGGLVTAVGANSSGAENSAVPKNTKVDKPADAPTANTNFTGMESGKATLLPGADNNKMTLGFNDEQGVHKEFTIEKNAQGKWVLAANSTLPENVSFDPTSGLVTFEPNAVSDSNVRADRKITIHTENGLGQDYNNYMTPNVDKATDPVIVNSTFSGFESGSATLLPGQDNIELSLSFQPEPATEGGALPPRQSFAIVKDPETGIWSVKAGTTKPAGVELNPQTGEITFSPNSVQDNVAINYTSWNGVSAEKHSQIVTPRTDKPSDAPVVTPAEDGSLTVRPGGDNIKQVVSFPDESSNNVTVTAVKEGSAWKLQAGAPAGVTINSSTGEIFIPAKAVKDNQPVTADGYNGLGAKGRDVENSLDNPAELVLRLETDSAMLSFDRRNASTGARTNSDGKTNDGTILISGVPENKVYEVSVDGGRTWVRQDAPEADAQGISFTEKGFELPSDASDPVTGRRYEVKARIVGQPSTETSLNVTYDHTTNLTFVRREGNTMIFKADADAVVYYRPYTNTAFSEATIARGKRDANGFIYLERDDAKTLSVYALDNAGNLDFLRYVPDTQSQGERLENIYSIYGPYKRYDGTDKNDRLIIGKGEDERFSGVGGKVEPSRGSIAGGAEVHMGAGDDYVYLHQHDNVLSGTIRSGGELYLDDGNDYASIRTVYEPAYKAIVDAGRGNDTIHIREPKGPSEQAFIFGTKAEVRLGEGDDILILGQPGTSGVHRIKSDGAKVDGGSGFDVIKFEGAGLTNSIRDFNGIKNIEKLDIKGTGINAVTLARGFLADNGAGWLQDDSGKGHNRVFIVDGNGDDVVNLYRNEGAHWTSTISYKGTQYNVYTLDQGYEVWTHAVTVHIL